jgi:hypothetical protein
MGSRHRHGPHGDRMDRASTRRAARRLVVLALLATVGHASVLAADAGTTTGTKRVAAKTPPGPRSAVVLPRTLEFGIYPGGAAGSVGPRGEPRPEVPELRAAALDALRPDRGRPFTVRLYDAFTSREDADEVPSWLRAQIAGHTSSGLQVELVLRYRPVASRGDVAGFERFVRSRVRQIGDDRRVVDLQITNEVNIAGAPDAADGAYAGAMAALVRGVVAADSEARERGLRHLRTGFNWAYEEGARAASFFAELERRGGARFARAVDWVGLNAYPGTWGPSLPRAALSDGARRATIRAMDVLRNTHLPRAGLRDAAIVFTESGYPTDADTRTAGHQRTVMAAVIGAVVAHRRTYGVRGYRWFDLRDADSSVPGLESQYGLMRDDYSPKPGFSLYRDLVDRHG